MSRYRVCSTPGCPNTYEGNNSRCSEHETTAKKLHWKDSRAYSSKGHRQFRSEVLRRDPICVLCDVAQATVADHHPRSRKDLIALGLNPNDPRFGRGLCKKCHDTETALHQPGGWNAR